jgi:hypothetical protein
VLRQLHRVYKVARSGLTRLHSRHRYALGLGPVRRPRKSGCHNIGSAISRCSCDNASLSDAVLYIASAL